MPRRDGILLAPQALLLTRSAWVTDIEHATPFVGIDYPRFDRPHTRWIVTRLLERDNCLGIVCWSEVCKRAFLERCPSATVAEKVHVAYPGIEADVASPHWAVRRSLRKLLFVFNKPEHNFFIKSGLEVVEAFKIARRSKAQPLELHVVGPVPAAAASRLQGIPGLTLHGRISREALRDVYESCDLLVLPTVTDTFGMAFLEAFSSGMPALAIRWFSIPEIIEHEDNGLLIDKPPGLVSWMDASGRPIMHCADFIRIRTHAEPDATTSTLLAEQIVRLWRDPSLLERLSVGASRTVREGRFSADQACAALERVAAEIRRRRP